MFATMLKGGVDDARERDLRSAWDERTSGDLPTGLVESYLMHSDDGKWRIVTLWESKEFVMAMRATVEKPTAILIFEQAGSRPSVSIWTVEGRAGRGDLNRPGFDGDSEPWKRRIHGPGEAPLIQAVPA